MTICPRSSDSFYIVSYYKKWVTFSWTHSREIEIGKRQSSKLSRKENAVPDILYKGIGVVVRKGNRIVAAKSGHSLRMHLEIL